MAPWYPCVHVTLMGIRVDTALDAPSGKSCYVARMRSVWDSERFASLLHALMDEANLSQGAVARLADVSPPQVGRWLKGGNRPTFDVLQRLAAAVQGNFPGRGDLAGIVHRMVTAAGYESPLVRVINSPAELITSVAGGGGDDAGLRAIWDMPGPEAGGWSFAEKSVLATIAAGMRARVGGDQEPELRRA